MQMSFFTKHDGKKNRNDRIPDSRNKRKSPEPHSGRFGRGENESGMDHAILLDRGLGFGRRTDHRNY